MVLTSKWGRIQPEIQIWHVQVTWRCMAVRELPKDVLKMASGLISPSGLAGHRRQLCTGLQSDQFYCKCWGDPLLSYLYFECGSSTSWQMLGRIHHLQYTIYLFIGHIYISKCLRLCSIISHYRSRARINQGKIISIGFICTFLSLSSLKDVQDYNLQTRDASISF